MSVLISPNGGGVGGRSSPGGAGAGIGVRVLSRDGLRNIGDQIRVSGEIRQGVGEDAVTPETRTGADAVARVEDDPQLASVPCLLSFSKMIPF